MGYDVHHVHLYLCPNTFIRTPCVRPHLSQYRFCSPWTCTSPPDCGETTCHPVTTGGSGWDPAQSSGVERCGAERKTSAVRHGTQKKRRIRYCFNRISQFRARWWSGGPPHNPNPLPPARPSPATISLPRSVEISALMIGCALPNYRCEKVFIRTLLALFVFLRP